MTNSHSFVHGATVFPHSSVPSLFWVVGNELEKFTLLALESQSLISEVDIKEKIKQNVTRKEPTLVYVCVVCDKISL